MSRTSAVRRMPPVCLLVALGYLLRGRVRHRRLSIGQILRMSDGRPYTVFRHVTLDVGDSPPADLPVLMVRFRFARGSPAVNRWLSLLPIPFIVGFPGFREKLWLADQETGYWRGVYQWESDAAAAAYQKSFVLSVMTRRAEPGTVCTEVAAHGRLSEYVASRRA